MFSIEGKSSRTSASNPGMVRLKQAYVVVGALNALTVHSRIALSPSYCCGTQLSVGDDARKRLFCESTSLLSPNSMSKPVLCIKGNAVESSTVSRQLASRVTSFFPHLVVWLVVALVTYVPSFGLVWPGIVYDCRGRRGGVPVPHLSSKGRCHSAAG